MFVNLEADDLVNDAVVETDRAVTGDREHMMEQELSDCVWERAFSEDGDHVGDLNPNAERKVDKHGNENESSDKDAALDISFNGQVSEGILKAGVFKANQCKFEAAASQLAGLRKDPTC